jgi:asparagine synthetase B (glutamine-hydrolysing)
MCGIAVLIGADASADTIARMLQVASRRGPELARARTLHGAQLAHAALGFVDVRENPQPFVADDGSAIVWNGEIYNFRELARRYALPARNDTQTLLFGLRDHGAAFLSEIDGQFAFVALLAQAGRAVQVVVGRDKWGICPLAFGYTPAGALAIGSTSEVVRASGARDVKTVPAGTFGSVTGTRLALHAWYRLPPTPLPARLQQASEVGPEDVRRFAEERVQSRIPDDPRDLYTTMGGIDSQFVSASVARHLRGAFGGAVTVVPWQAQGTGTQHGGDYPCVRATLKLLASEGIRVAHHVAVLTSQFAAENLERLLKLLGPDLFQLICAFGEDLVAATVHDLGGRTIMTAGGPDEAGRSYERWTFLHRGLDQELAWRRLAEQFSSSEGVRAGLVFGERGLENRVPLADLIELATQIAPDQKQRVHHEGDGLTLGSMRMESKIFWRQALRGVLPEVSLAAPKQPIHGSIGAMRVLYDVLRNDREYRQRRGEFIREAFALGWNAIVFADMRELNPNDELTECQVYALYRWSLLEPELFHSGGEQRYGPYSDFVARCEDDPLQRMHKPLCYDWLLGRDIPIRPVR